MSAHQLGAGAKNRTRIKHLGEIKECSGLRFHATVNALGNLMSFALTTGQEHDLEGADQLLRKMRQEVVIADTAYNAEERVIDPLIKTGKLPVIPCKSNRK